MLGQQRHQSRTGFTIVELVITIVVIAILSTLSVLAYNGIQRSAAESAIKSDLSQAAKKLSVSNVTDGQYPASFTSSSGGITYQYTYNSGTNAYCLTASSGSLEFYISDDNTTPQAGACLGHVSSGPVTDGAFIQTITSANCPTTRTRAVDARDNRTYWVQKLADDKCWMLTNLAYAGGGTNTYGDTKTLSNGTGGSTTYTAARYYIPPSGSNVTTEPTAPSTSTDGSGQYGYLYNWCGAMGGQATAACANATTPAPDAAVSACPSGWRLPTGNGGEFAALNTAVNSGSTTTDTGLRTNWLLQRSGTWSGGFYQQGSSGVYWSSSTSGSATHAHSLFDNSAVPAVYLTSSSSKYAGFAVRCVAN